MTAQSASRRRSAAKAAEPATPDAPARISLGPLERSIGYALRRAQLAVFAEFNRVIGKYDLRPAQFSVLLVIGENPGLTQMQVGEQLGIQRTNFVALFRELEERGLARRAPGSDRRSYALFLTEAGEDLMRRVRRAHAAHERRVVAAIGEEARDQLLATLRKLAALQD